MMAIDQALEAAQIAASKTSALEALCEIAEGLEYLTERALARGDLKVARALLRALGEVEELAAQL